MPFTLQKRPPATPNKTSTTDIQQKTMLMLAMLLLWHPNVLKLIRNNLKSI